METTNSRRHDAGRRLWKSLKPVLFSLGALLWTGTAARAGEADLAIPDLWKHGKFDQLGGITPGSLLFWGSFVILGTLGISLYQLVQIHKQPAHKSMLAISEIIIQTCKTYLIQQGKFLLMLFCFIAVAMGVYLLGFSHEAETAKGKIKSVDAVKKEFVVTDKSDKDWTLHTEDSGKIHRADKEVELNDLKKGEDVEIRYEKDGDKLIAKEILDGAQNGQAFSPIVTLIIVLVFALVGMGGSYAVAWYGIRVNTFAN
jgi:hypothetical protein